MLEFIETLTLAFASDAQVSTLSTGTLIRRLDQRGVLTSRLRETLDKKYQVVERYPVAIFRQSLLVRTTGRGIYFASPFFAELPRAVAAERETVCVRSWHKKSEAKMVSLLKYCFSHRQTLGKKWSFKKTSRY